MVEIKQKLLPAGHRNRPGYPMKPKGVLFHTTNNWKDGAGDEMHGEYMRNTERVVSWHVTVDKDSSTQHIPYNENAWHAGDGTNGQYNRNWIGVEIACEAVELGEPLDDATYRNAVEVVAKVMIANDLTDQKQLQPHAVVYGKDCPHHTLFNREQFKRDVFAKMHELQTPKPYVPDWKKDAVQWLYDEGFLTGDDWKKDIEKPLPLWAEAIILKRLFEKLKGEM